MEKSHAKMIPIAVFDISSGSVAGTHVLAPKMQTKEPHISMLASARVFSEPKEDIDIERFVSETLSNLDSVIGTLQKADNHKPKSVFVLLASPWFLSQTRTIVYNKTSSFTCTQKLIDSLIEKEIKFVMEHDMERFGSMGKEGVIIEKQISKITLNGYNTDNPFGKKTQSLELSLVVTISPKKIVEEIKAHINKGYRNLDINFITSPYATFVVTRDFLGSQSELMIIDAGEETTDIACVKNELFLYQQSFPIGFYELYRKISTSNHDTLSETRALVETFRLGKLSASMTSNLQKILEDFGDSWSKSLEEHLSNANSIKTPSSIYVTSTSPFSSFFSKYVEQSAFLAHYSGVSDIKIINIDSSLFSKHISSIDLEILDDSLVIGALFASRLL